jgi:hypothetical protein
LIATDCIPFQAEKKGRRVAKKREKLGDGKK